MSCSVSSLSKYTSRTSPPRPANSAGCRGKTHIGNDGNAWISKPAINGVYRWVKVGVGSPTKRRSTKRTSTKRRSTKRKSTKRKSTKRKSTKRKSTKRKSTKRKSTKRRSTKRK